jgi:hypothetical protein
MAKKLGLAVRPNLVTNQRHRRWHLLADTARLIIAMAAWETSCRETHLVVHCIAEYDWADPVGDGHRICAQLSVRCKYEKSVVSDFHQPLGHLAQAR